MIENKYIDTVGGYLSAMNIPASLYSIDSDSMLFKASIDYDRLGS